jgi:hypothetical protein
MVFSYVRSDGRCGICRSKSRSLWKLVAMDHFKLGGKAPAADNRQYVRRKKIPHLVTAVRRLGNGVFFASSGACWRDLCLAAC